MSTVVKDLGAATAYGYAVEKGYTGTEAEFAELMASYATVGQTAVNAAQTATTKASEAATSATTATTKASEATTAAQTASTKASEAVGCVETATQKATEATQSASQALGYKNDAESAKTASQTAQGLAESARDTAVSAKNDAESARDDAVQAKEDAESAVASIADALDDKAPVITDTASGAIASFSDGADDLPLKSLVVDINPVQDLSHGDPSPENICPISGWTEVDVEQRGKNLLSPNFSDYEEGFNYRYLNNIVPFEKTARFTFTDKDTSIDLSGCYIGFQTGLTTTTSTATAFRWAIDNGTVQSNTSNVAVNGTVCYGVMIYPKTQETFDKIFSRYNVMVELGSTATPYEPYKGESVTIDLGQTVYGGKLDVLSGELVVYPYYASYNGETLTGEWISDRDKYVSGTTPTIGAQVVNIGAQGVTVQLEPHEVASLYGVNNLWADSGDAEVVYRADTKLFIERLTAPDSADMIADANITSGQYFMVGNSLYKATANIANGSAIVVGTNCIRKSLSEALNEINA